MCGRYTLIANLPFDAFSDTRIEFRPRYNIAPGQRSLVVLSRGRAQHWLHAGELSDAPELTRTAVSARINRIENDDPDCMEPVAQAAFEFE